VVGADASDFAGFEYGAEAGTVQVVKVANVYRSSQAAIGNRHIQASESPVFGLCHADCSFGPGALAEFTRVALEGQVCGIVGIDRHRNYRWAKDVNEITPISTLDSCSVFFRRDSGLRFDDAIFDGLHCHVEDLCLQAQAKGITVSVPKAQASHAGQSTFNPAWRAEYEIYRTRLAEKWHGVRFETT